MKKSVATAPGTSTASELKEAALKDVTKASAPVEDNIAMLSKPTLWMLCNHLEFANTRGAFNQLPTEQQFNVLANLLSAKQALGGWAPPKAADSTTLPA